MIQAAYNRLALALMLIAALASYANASRLAGCLLVGDITNLVAAQNWQSRDQIAKQIAALPQGSAEAETLSEKLNDGDKSRALAQSLPDLSGLIAPAPIKPQLDAPKANPPRIETPAFTTHWAHTPGALMTLDLPPPPYTGGTAACRPLADPRCTAAQARAPPARA